MKFYGKLGFIKDVEVHPGQWETSTAIEMSYRGSMLRQSYSVKSAERLSSEYSIVNRISIIMDPYLHQNLGVLKYVVWNNTYWNINAVEITPPRVVLSLEGVYTGVRATQD